jgi:hypothetical protein
MIDILPLALLFAAQVATPFVPAEFKVPAKVVRKEYQLAPLGPALAKHDFDAYMSSIEHIRANFGSGKWPTAGITMAEAVKDVEGEEERFKARKSFTYAVLTPDGKSELGCVYVSPSREAGYDAVVRMWVTKAAFDSGLQTRLEADVRAWLAKEWPFKNVLYKNKR